MSGTQAAAVRRMSDANFTCQYFSGIGIDIGPGMAPLNHFMMFFPRISKICLWDIGDGDAQFLKGVPDECFDFVHSSHCLEHIVDPREALKNWFRILKPGGHLICTVPDEDMYEQGVFPSTFNTDHKWTFTIQKKKSWCSHSINLLSLFAEQGEEWDIQKIERLDSTYRYGLPRVDQTAASFSECGIEFVVRKRPRDEIAKGGRLPAQM